MDIAKLRDPIIAEQATGIKQQGELRFWSKGKKISQKLASKCIREYKEIAVPSAGAGSYYEVFEKLGFSELKPMVLSSSAGDWEFGVKDKTGWRVAGQDNRYPHYGFTYWISSDLWGFETFEDLLLAVKEYSGMI